MDEMIEKGLEIIPQLKGRKVLVVGDLMIDEYIWGDVSRMSPEAPVPVVGVNQETLRLGGASNVAHNVISLGGKIELCGLVGDDQMGRYMISDLKGRGVGTRGIITSADRPTTVKTRVIAHNQQVVRVDREVIGLLTNEEEQIMMASIRSLLAGCGAIVISDYAKGVVTPILIREIVNTASEAGVSVVVDPKVNHFATYRDVTVLTPNLLEASAGAGMIIDSIDALLEAGHIILEKLNSSYLIITRGDQGMTLFTKGGQPVHIPAVSREVYDVTGAGDTVVSALALAISAGLSMEASASIANVAAGIVVGEVGTVPVTLQQLTNRFKELSSKGL